MADDFDAYRKWLGISSRVRPPNHYDLLGITLDEEDEEVIQAAIDQRKQFVESKRGQGHDAAVTEILYQIGEAEVTLFNHEMRRKYDRQMNLWEKRRKSRQVDSTSPRSRIRSRPGRIVGEDGGIVPTFVKIMAVICVGFGIMAWLSFGMWNRPAKQHEVAQQPIVQPQPVVQPTGQPIQQQAAVAEEPARVQNEPEMPKSQFNAPIGNWIEERPNTPGGDRIRTFKADGTLVIETPKLKQSVSGTWRRDGSRVYFSHPPQNTDEQPTVDKWFEIARSDEQQMTIRMMGQREYVWVSSQRAAESSKDDLPEIKQTVQNENLVGATLFKGHNYKVFREAGLDWKTAKKRCEEMGGHLVTISNEEENKFITALATKTLGDINNSGIWLVGHAFGEVVIGAERLGDPTMLEDSDAESINMADSPMVMGLEYHIRVVTFGERQQGVRNDGSVALVEQPAVPVVGVDHGPVFRLLQFLVPEPDKAFESLPVSCRILCCIFQIEFTELGQVCSPLKGFGQMSFKRVSRHAEDTG